MYETTMTSAVRYVGDAHDLPALPDEHETWLRPVALVAADDPATAVADIIIVCIYALLAAGRPSVWLML